MKTLNPPITVSQAQLREVLEAAIKKATPLTMTTLTVPEQRLNPALGGQKVRKLVRINCMGGCRYFNAAMKQGVETSEQRAWGERDTALVSKPNKDGSTSYYLPVQLNHVSRPLYLIPGPGGKLAYVPAAQVEPYLRAKREMIVDYKDYSLNSLLGVNINKQRYRVRHEAVA